MVMTETYYEKVGCDGQCSKCVLNIFPECIDMMDEKVSAYYIHYYHDGLRLGSFVAEADGHIVNFQVFGKKEWGKGYGTRMMTEGLEELKKLGLTRVYLETHSDNFGARKVYERAGMEFTGIRWSGSNIVGYEKELV